MPSPADLPPTTTGDPADTGQAAPCSALTSRSLELIRTHRWRVRVEPLYGPHGSSVYARLTEEDRTEIREIVAAARRTEGPILELAAGAGRLTLPLLALGRSVTAVDTSAEMLEQLTARVPPRDAGRLSTVLADMTAVVAAEAFGLVVLGATSITLLEPDRRGALYDAIAAGAAAGARFVVTVAEDGTPAPAPPGGADSGRPGAPVLSHESRGARRLVNILVPPGANGTATVLTSSVTRLGRSDLVAELLARGFTLVDETAVRGVGGTATGVVLLEVACPPR